MISVPGSNDPPENDKLRTRVCGSPSDTFRKILNNAAGPTAALIPPPPHPLDNVDSFSYSGRFQPGEDLLFAGTAQQTTHAAQQTPTKPPPDVFSQLQSLVYDLTTPTLNLGAAGDKFLKLILTPTSTQTPQQPQLPLD